MWWLIGFPHTVCGRIFDVAQCHVSAIAHSRVFHNKHGSVIKGKRLDSITNVHKVFGDDRQPTQKAKVLYARVSSGHQRGDLERQITGLRQRYPGHEIISDIGSGLNWKRRGFVIFLDPNLWSGSLKKMGRGSWFSVKKFVPYQ